MSLSKDVIKKLSVQKQILHHFFNGRCCHFKSRLVIGPPRVFGESESAETSAIEKALPLWKMKLFCILLLTNGVPLSSVWYIGSVPSGCFQQTALRNLNCKRQQKNINCVVIGLAQSGSK